MSEEEIIKYIKDEIENETDTFHWFDDIPNNLTRKQIEESIKAHQGLLDLYNKEKEKNKHIAKSTIDFVNSHYIHKDTIRELLNKDVGQYMKFYRDIEQLLEE